MNRVRTILALLLALAPGCGASSIDASDASSSDAGAGNDASAGSDASVASDTSSSQNACPDVPACGGEIAPGRYRATCLSYSGKMTGRGCRDGVTILSSNLTVTGTYTFNANHTFEADVTTTGTLVESIPASCTLETNGLTCAQLGPSMSRPGTSVTCTGDDPCICTALINSHELGPGTYTTSETRLYRTLDSRGAPFLTEYCATPTTLSLTRDLDVGDVTGPMDSTFRFVAVYTKE